MKRFWMTAAALLISTSALPCDGLQVKQAWVREAPPMARTLVAYMQLHNTSNAPLQITDIKAVSGFDGSMLHGTEIVDGVSRMRHVDVLDLAAGDTAELAPGGLHLMLFEPQQALRAGDEVDLQIDCAAGQAFPLTVPVRRSAP